MRNHQYIGALRHVDDLARDGQPAAAREIGLHDIHLRTLDQFAESPLRRLLLSAGNRRRYCRSYLSISVVILRVQDLFNEKRTVRLERADYVDRLFRGSFHKPARVDQEIVAVAHLPARGGDEFHIAPGILAEYTPTELHRGEAAIEIASRGAPHTLRRRTEQGAGIRPNALEPACSQQHTNRLAIEFAADIP